eukprot:gene28835-37842_t
MSTSWVEKVFPITTDAVICSASSCVGNEGAEFKEFLREVQEEVFRYKLTESLEIGNESRLGLESIYFLAKKLIRHKYPSIHVFVAGLCGETKSENSFKLFEILPGGTGIEGENLLVAGSGGVNIVSLLGDIFQSDSTVTVQQAAPQVKRALTAATKLDHGSGGVGRTTPTCTGLSTYISRSYPALAGNESSVTMKLPYDLNAYN